MREICMLCRSKQKPEEICRKLNRIEELLRKEESAEGGWYLNWGIRFRCHYGLGCPSLDVERINQEEQARRLTPKMRQLALHGSDGKFYEVLRILQGDFPVVYRQMEIWRAERRKACGE